MADGCGACNRENEAAPGASRKKAKKQEYKRVSYWLYFSQKYNFFSTNKD
jgi:hypothetical protein